ncbi:RAMP superfamily CRISPR-associated protein, partial [Acinetobacter baumannii]
AATAGGKHRTTRVAINAETGAAKTGALQVVELVAPVGQDVEFTGKAIVRCADGQANRLVNALRRALALIPAIGGLKSAGFGEVRHTALEAGP